LFFALNTLSTRDVAYGQNVSVSSPLHDVVKNVRKRIFAIVAKRVTVGPIMTFFDV